MDVPCLLDLPALLERKSHVLLGPRQTGKSWLVHRALPDARVYDLLETSVFLALSRNPRLERASELLEGYIGFRGRLHHRRPR